MRVENSTVDQVRNRLAMHKQKRERDAAAEGKETDHIAEYEARMKVLLQEEEEKKRLKKEKKRQKKDEEPSVTEGGGGGGGEEAEAGNDDMMAMMGFAGFGGSKKN